MGVGKQQRRIAIDPREKRNAGDWAGNNPSFIGDSEVIAITSEGVLTLTLKSDGGLENIAAELSIKLNGNDLVLGASGLSISSSFTESISSDLTATQAIGDDQALEQSLIAQAMGMFNGS